MQSLRERAAAAFAEEQNANKEFDEQRRLKQVAEFRGALKAITGIKLPELDSLDITIDGIHLRHYPGATEHNPYVTLVDKCPTCGGTLTTHKLPLLLDIGRALDTKPSSGEYPWMPHTCTVPSPGNGTAMEDRKVFAALAMIGLMIRGGHSPSYVAEAAISHAETLQAALAKHEAGE